MAEDQALEQIRSYLRTLKLRKMEKALDELLSLGARENLPVSKVIERLLAIETEEKKKQEMIRFLRQENFEI